MSPSKRTEKDDGLLRAAHEGKAASVDVLFLPDYYNMVGLIAKQVREKGVKASSVGGTGGTPRTW